MGWAYNNGFRMKWFGLGPTPWLPSKAHKSSFFQLTSILGFFCHSHYRSAFQGFPVMEVATTASTFSLSKRISPLTASSHHRKSTRTMSFSPSSLRTKPLSTNFLVPFVGGSVSGDFSGVKLRPSSLNPDSFRGSKGKRGVVTMVSVWTLLFFRCHWLFFLITLVHNCSLWVLFWRKLRILGWTFVACLLFYYLGSLNCSLRVLFWRICAMLCEK